MIIKKKLRKLSNLNFGGKKHLKLSNNSCYTINNNTKYNITNRPNGFCSKENEIEINNQLQIFNQEDMKSHCFYKIIDNTNYNFKKYNVLNDCSINPEYFGYNECFISIDVTNGSLKISPNISFNKIKNPPKDNEYISIIKDQENYFYMNIKLKEIFSVFIEKYMHNILKIQNILLKYNYENNTNKDKNEKIKAALSNLFSFSFSLGNKNNNIGKTKIDLIFNNFEKYNFWMNTLNSIAKNNVKSSKTNILSYKNLNLIQKSKNKSIVDKSKNNQTEFNFKKIFNFKSWNDKLRTKSNIQSNKILK